MDEQFGDELRSLRQRAYGPNADIQEDPIALERLRELEAQAASRPSVPAIAGLTAAAGAATTDQRVAATYSGSDAVSAHQGREIYGRSLSTSQPEQRNEQVGQVSSRPDDAAHTAEPGGPDNPDAPPAKPQPDEPISSPQPHPRRRGALIWAGALTAALLVGAILSYVAVGLTPGSVGVLQADPEAAWPDEFSPRASGSAIFEEFHGLTVVLVPQDWNGGAPSPCLFILTDPTKGLIGGAGCGAGDFEPVTAITVTEKMPKSLLEEFPVGSALQFQLRDGEVVVFAHRP